MCNKQHDLNHPLLQGETYTEIVQCWNITPSNCIFEQELRISIRYIFQSSQALKMFENKGIKKVDLLVRYLVDSSCNFISSTSNR